MTPLGMEVGLWVLNFGRENMCNIKLISHQFLFNFFLYSFVTNHLIILVYYFFWLVYTLLPQFFFAIFRGTGNCLYFFQSVILCLLVTFSHEAKFLCDVNFVCLPILLVNQTDFFVDLLFTWINIIDHSFALYAIFTIYQVIFVVFLIYFTMKFLLRLCIFCCLAGTFKLTLQFTEDYPNKPPTVRFVSRMFHPNSKL